MNLGCGLGALFTFNPVISIASITVVLRQLSRKRVEVVGLWPARTGVVAWASGVFTIAMLLICAIASEDIYIHPVCAGSCNWTSPLHLQLFSDLWIGPFWIMPVLLIIASLLHAVSLIAFVATADHSILTLIAAPQEPLSSETALLA